MHRENTVRVSTFQERKLEKDFKVFSSKHYSNGGTQKGCAQEACSNRRRHDNGR